jgi:hypothetical protein
MACLKHCVATAQRNLMLFNQFRRNTSQFLPATTDVKNFTENSREVKKLKL